MLYMPKNLSKIIAGNLAALMDSREDLNTIAKVAAAARVGVATVHRVRRAEGACATDTLEAIARAFDLDAWQLLIPSIDPRNPPALRAMNASEAELYQRLKALIAAKK